MAVALVGGKARFTTAALAFGCHKIAAHSNGLAAGPVWYQASTSATLTGQTVRGRES